MGERRAHGVPQGEGSGQAVLEGWGGGSAARLWLVLDRRRRMGEGRAAGGPWGDGLGTGDLGRRRGGLNDVLPPLFSEINRIAVTVWNRPAFVRASPSGCPSVPRDYRTTCMASFHPGLSSARIRDLLARPLACWTVLDPGTETLSAPPPAPAPPPPGAARRSCPWHGRGR